MGKINVGSPYLNLFTLACIQNANRKLKWQIIIQ